MKILTLGTFDTPHLGHYNFLKSIKEMFPGAEIWVALNTDEFVAKFKGKTPLFSMNERARLIGNIDFITPTINTGGENAQFTIEEVAPDVIVIGSDWARKDYLKQLNITQDYLDEKGIALVYIPYTQGISSSEIKKRCLQQ